MTEEERLFVELAQVTKLGQAKWVEILKEPPDIQKSILQNYADQDWSNPATPLGQQVINILTAISNIATPLLAPVTGVISLIQALKG